MDTVIPVDADWNEDFQEWLEPFGAGFKRSKQRCWAPRYLQELIGPGARSSVEPMAERVYLGQTQQLHHFVSTLSWPTAPLEQVLRRTADALVGGDAVLIVDDTALPKQGKHSVGVKRQHCGVLGEQANCQVLVSPTLAQKEVPVPIVLRLYLPKDWAQDKVRREGAKVPRSISFEPKGDIALAEIDVALANGVRFGMVLADANYSSSADFCAGLTQRGLCWAVGVQPTQKVYPADVELSMQANSGAGRPAKYPRPSTPNVSMVQMIDMLGPTVLRRCSWHCGTKGMLGAHFAAVRVGVADGTLVSHGQHLPGQAAWLVCEARSSGECKYYYTNHPSNTPGRTPVRAIKTRWACKQAHQQLKDELCLDHYEWQILAGSTPSCLIDDDYCSSVSSSLRAMAKTSACRKKVLTTNL